MTTTDFIALWDAAGDEPQHPYAAARREWEAVLSPRVDLSLVERAEQLGVDAGRFALYLLATDDLGLAVTWALDHEVWGEDAEQFTPRFTPDDVADWLAVGWYDAARAVAWDLVGLGPREAVAWSGLIRNVGAAQGEYKIGVDPDEAVAAIAGGWPERSRRGMPRRPGDLDDAIARGTLMLDA